MLDLACNIGRALEELDRFERLGLACQPGRGGPGQGPRFAFSRACRASDEPPTEPGVTTLPHRATYSGRHFLPRATAALVGIVESVCMRELQAYLADGQRVVGVQTEIHHMGAAISGVTLFIHGRAEPVGEDETAFEIRIDDPHDRVATARITLFTAPRSRIGSASRAPRRSDATALAGGFAR